MSKNALHLIPFTFITDTQRRIKGGAQGAAPLYFLQPFVFCNHFEKLQTILFEVELIINDAPLIYVYPNTIMFNTQLFVI